MKTEAEKLQALIELAWENGWRLPPPEPFKIKPGAEILQTRQSDDPKSIAYSLFRPLALETTYRRENQLLFDHDFIKALCISKYGRVDYWMNLEPDEPHDGWAWEHHLAKLAISDNRISYLYEIFISP